MSTARESATATAAGRLDSLARRHPMPTYRPLAWTVILLLGGALAWAYVARLDEVAVATGEVTPRGRVKVVQHLEGGIIQEILVEEGSVVGEGQPLVRLDLASGGENRKELAVRLDSLLLVRARLAAEAADSALKIPAELAERRPELAEAERQAFEARQRELESTLAVFTEQVRQRQLEVKELTARRNAVTRSLALAKRRLQMSKSLLEEGLTAKMEHLQLEAEVEDMEGQGSTLASSIPRARAAVEEARNRLEEGRDSFRREAQDELGRTEQSIARIREVLARATEQGQRAEIKSPIDGVVKNMRYHTIGGVVRPGEPILEIVPTGETLVVSAKLNPTDRGYVTEGQPAVVKVSTYDFVRYGGLDGHVVLVAPDSSADSEGRPFYRVIVETDRTYLGDAEGKLPILPGMQATVDIHTGDKSVLEYLIKPVLKLRHEAFRER